MRSKLVILAVATIVVGSFGLAGWGVWRNIRASGYDSCLASLVDQVRKRDSTRELAKRSPDWIILSADEVDHLMIDVKGPDCGGFDDSRLDFYGNRINIALRQESKDRWHWVIIWSNGADGVSGTEDDIVMPYGQTIPK